MAAPRVRIDSFIDPCIPTLAAKPPSGPGWVHEIKHDGYRLIARRDGAAVLLNKRKSLERVKGIEPSSSAWKTVAGA